MAIRKNIAFEFNMVKKELLSIVNLNEEPFKKYGIGEIAQTR